ncbi:gamma-glutamyl-gamma-aminobutyrate hydrolase family protein [Natrinema halophilum]|uniref:Gamma-glutamyl-gamma-aminobutyrate hydrolase family protein n=1 Tax=Natrinema halophilum TaxID=1699371 RepID=A0A7D5GFT5_9EURY|nr:gamma-glutamyl-gamma-aminobutyrate hydrolase family protein [Natrinema halophilum]QLG47854.1 gamma-glutamyl-gamma-aminobutyrate hydrolase family protein [Natrinema halophilum]
MSCILATMRSIRDPATGELRDSLSRDWSSYLDDHGITVIPVANTHTDPSTVVEDVTPDALVLTNGEDIGSHRPRDRTERALIDSVVEEGIPVLGVCRGHQFVNSYYGGDIVAVEEHVDHGAHAGTEHGMRIEEEPFRSMVGESLTVNSYHDMGVTPEGVAPPLEQYAFADGGRIVEGLYHPDRPVLTIQWHPERPLPDREPLDRLVTRFLEGEFTW